MKVEELFRQLSYGELSNLSVGTDGSGAIQEDKYPQIIQHTNAALRRLFTRFPLREKDVMIEQVAHITNYHLRIRFAESYGADVSYPYIKDLPEEPFVEDVVRILRVHDSTGRPLMLNDVGNPQSLFTPQPDVLQVPNPHAGVALGVVYQAYHAPLVDGQDGTSTTPEEVLNQEVEIPAFLEEALVAFIGYKVYSNMNGQENLVKSQELMATYEAACAEIEAMDLVNSTFHTSHSKLEQRGFI